MRDFKPRDVVIEPIPFIGTFGKSGREVAAAFVVAARKTSNTWQEPLTINDLAARVESRAIADLNLRSILTNPFLKPDFPGLVEQGDIDLFFIFTEQGMAKLEKWAKSSDVEAVSDEK